MLTKVKKILSDSCVIFTVFVLFLLAIYALISNPDDGIVSGLSFETSLLLLASSILLRTFHNILYIEKIHLALRIATHYVLTTGTSFSALMLIREVTNTSQKQSPATAFIILSLLSLIYIFACIVFMILYQRRKEKSNSKKEYTSITNK